MAMPARPKTVISPKVSNPLKSTNITFTIFVPPPPLTEFSIKYFAIVEYYLVYTLRAKIATPTPAKIEMMASALSLNEEDSLLVKAGR